MPVKQIYKNIKKGIKPIRINSNSIAKEKIISKPKRNKKNNDEKKEQDMTTEQFNKIEDLAQEINVPKQVKVVKKDRGLIERTESSKIVLTEDNRQVLND